MTSPVSTQTTSLTSSHTFEETQTSAQTPNQTDSISSSSEDGNDCCGMISSGIAFCVQTFIVTPITFLWKVLTRCDFSTSNTGIPRLLLGGNDLDKEINAKVRELSQTSYHIDILNEYASEIAQSCHRFHQDFYFNPNRIQRMIVFHTFEEVIRARNERIQIPANASIEDVEEYMQLNTQNRELLELLLRQRVNQPIYSFAIWG